MSIFINSTDLFESLGTNNKIVNFLDECVIRIDRNGNSHDYGKVGDIVKVKFDNNSSIRKVGGKEMYNIGHLYIPHKDKYGSNIFASEFSIVINSLDKIKVLRTLVSDKETILNKTKEYCDDLEKYMNEYELTEFNADHFISNEITKILDTELDVTARTQKLVELYNKRMLI